MCLLALPLKVCPLLILCPHHLPLLARSQTSSSLQSPLLRVQLPASPLWSKETLPQETLVNSGTDSNFIDSPLVIQAGIPLLAFALPKDMNALDGKLLSRIPHHTAPVTLIISGNHHKTIQPLIIPSPNSPALLCLPWLKFHNQWELFLSLPLPTISHRSW